MTKIKTQERMLQLQIYMESFLLTDAVALSSTHTKFGAAVDQIHLDGFGCNGSESNLTECSHGFTVSCSWHFRSAGVRCQGTKIKFICREMEIYMDQIFSFLSDHKHFSRENFTQKFSDTTALPNFFC